jgi:hypothetical protein
MLFTTSSGAALTLLGGPQLALHKVGVSAVGTTCRIRVLSDTALALSQTQHCLPGAKPPLVNFGESAFRFKYQIVVSYTHR